MKKIIVLLSALMLSACTLTATTDEYFRSKPSVSMSDLRSPYVTYSPKYRRHFYECYRPTDVLVKFRGNIYCTDRFTASRLKFYRYY